MKIKKMENKPALNKTTVSNLEKVALENIKGGITPNPDPADSVECDTWFGCSLLFTCMRNGCR